MQRFGLGANKKQAINKQKPLDAGFSFQAFGEYRVEGLRVV